MTKQCLHCDRFVNLRNLAIMCAVFFWLALRPAVADNAAKKPQPLPVSGHSSSKKLSDLDSKMLRLMQKYKLSAAQLAVAKNGTVIYSKAFGYSDKEHKIPATTANLFRIASCSKPITAVAIMSLIEQGKLRLEEKMTDILADLKPPKGEPFDKRLDMITVRQLLEHASGFSNADGDPQFSYLKLAPHKYGQPFPATAESIVRYRFAFPLNREPGSKYEYSNFGYNVLGRIIEHKTGEHYDDYVKKNILAPAGITDMVIGHVRTKDKMPLEVYFDDAGYGGEGWSIYDDELTTVPVSYGSLYIMEAMDSHGGWLGCAEDLVKFCAAADGSNPSGALLKQHTIDIMTEPPEIGILNKEGLYYAKGWDVVPKRGEWNHSGALTWGVSSYMCHLPDGVQVACVFNHLPPTIGKYFREMPTAVLTTVRHCHGEF